MKIFEIYGNYICIGVPSLNIPTLDPFSIDHHDYSYKNGNLRGKLTISNTKVYGLAKAHFASIQEAFDQDNFRFEMDLSVPKMFIEGDYKVDGFFGDFQIGNKGEGENIDSFCSEGVP